MKRIKIITALLLLLAVTVSVSAEQRFPEKGWKDRPNPIAGPDAVTGGEISVFAGQYPKSLNYYLDNNVLSAEIFGAMFETLLSMNPVTMEYEPGLASTWSISDDKKEFTFTINKKARWSDGSPVTASDVKFTYDIIMDPKNLTGPHKVDMERFHPPDVIDDYTIRFVAENVHWKNLGVVGGFHILCRNALKKKDFNKINFAFPVVSGPYMLGKIDEGVSITMERRKDWWNRSSKSSLGTGNFQQIKFKFFAERENAFEAFKKGNIDLFPIYTSRIWINETGGEKFLKNRIVKQKIFNHKPIGFQGFAMNLRKPPFDDIRVRKAMALLLDRKKMNSVLMYNQYFLHRSYFEDLYSKDIPCPNPLIKMDKEKARELLKKAGWIVNPETGFLEKNKKKFSFKFLTRSSSAEKFLAIYAEDLKDVGIELVIDKKDWAAWAKDMDGFNFQMTWAVWGSGIFKDPEGMWSSMEADRKGGNNITGFKNKKVDLLIEEQKSNFNIGERNKIYRKIDQLVYEDFPYVLLWNINYTRLLYWNRFGTPDTVLSKYGDERSAYWYWWVDEDSEADLRDAMEEETPLPQKERSIVFDDLFKP
ncbi:microcin C transport system substrate-binding protein [Desulfosarcina sp. BuS5]|uniref:extracellular solute-binding protein n=1 Tax=Desulfosarcina sp. BuS5 TaxID=933262 RepID=UPI0006841C81|nr:extracellular solute-binding protein [Desulfosarcina sp. BuS5]WDN87380.1 microcin C transport system substrate-binding protein [Desulfosarcina sp. BuS5]